MWIHNKAVLLLDVDMASIYLGSGQIPCMERCAVWREVFRERVRREIERQGMTQVQVAGECGLSTSYLSRILVGDIKSPSLDHIYAIADALGLGLIDVLPNRLENLEERT